LPVRREVTVSGADNSTAILFLSAANLLLGERSDATGDHDAKRMLRAPDAPGLVSFGAQFDPVLADRLHAGSPMIGVSGVGVLRSVFPRGRNLWPRLSPRLPRCASSNWSTPSSQPNAASVEMPRSTRTHLRRAMINADQYALLQPAAGPPLISPSKQLRRVSYLS
jgi:hypothetical protein